MTRRVLMLTFANAEMLDAVGPLEVFAKANELSGKPEYHIALVAPTGGALTMTSGLTLQANLSFDDDPGPVHTLLVGGGDGARSNAREAKVQAWLGRLAPRVDRLGSVCTGAFVLAAGGYLDGRRVTTHWRRWHALAEAFPKVEVDPDAIFVRDGRIVTSAGITAGIDLALHLVEEDLGRELAFAVARRLVVYGRRTGGQSQFSAALLAQAPGGSRFDILRDWISANPGADLQVEALAARAGMSSRSFHRHFTRETGMTPARYVELARVDAARAALEESREPMDQIAHRLGFGHAETLRRVFHRHLSIGPGDYRRQWARNSSDIRPGVRAPDRASASKVA